MGVELKKWLRENLELVAEYEDRYGSANNQRIGLKLAGDKEPFTYITVFVPENER